MVIYYSISGNTAYVAKRIANIIGDVAVDAGKRMRSGEYEYESYKPYIICAPTYYMNVPKEFIDYLSLCSFKGSNEVAVVLTASFSAGNAKNKLVSVLKSKELRVLLVNVFYPPTSNILGLCYPSEASAEKTFERMDKEVKHYAELFKAKEPILTVGSSLFGIIGSLIGSATANKRSDKKFAVSDSCDSCGLCAQICMRNNIEIKDGKPVFGGNCNHCGGCVNRCPKNAIEYGKTTEGRTRRKLGDLIENVDIDPFEDSESEGDVSIAEVPEDKVE